jgi:hypothetical protein
LVGASASLAAADVKQMTGDGASNKIDSDRGSLGALTAPEPTADNPRGTGPKFAGSAIVRRPRGDNDDARRHECRTHTHAHDRRNALDPGSFFSAQPQGPFKVFEALNALAVVTATISSGTGDVAECANFFKEAFEDQVGVIDRAKADGTFPKKGP